MTTRRASIPLAILALLLSTVSGTASGQQVEITAPFCEMLEKPTGDYETRSELVKEPFTDYREETIPERWVTKTTRVEYTAYRPKTELVAKVVFVARTVVRPVVKWVRKVHTWFQRTWLGTLVRRVTSWLEPVTTWVKETVWDRVIRWVEVTTMEPYTAYRIEHTRVRIPARQVLVPFTNYIWVRKTYTVPITITVTGTVYRKVTVDSRGVPVEALQDMLNRLPRCEPLADRLRDVYVLWEEFRRGYSQYASGDGDYRDALDIYLNGVAAEGQAGSSPTLANGFGAGPEAWNAGDTNFTYPDAKAAQYFRMRELLKEWGLVTEYEAGTYVDKHTNLCGELSVIAAVGDSVRHGLTTFHGTAAGRAILQDGSTTGWWDLESFFGQYPGWSAQTAAGAATQQELGDELRQGKAVIALVNLDASSGILKEGHADVAHWVTVLEVLPTQDGTGAVRIYNPLQNREEYYTWEYFSGTWAQTNGNSSTFLRVTAEQDLAEQFVPPQLPEESTSAPEAPVSALPGVQPQPTGFASALFR